MHQWHISVIAFGYSFNVRSVGHKFWRQPFALANDFQRKLQNLSRGLRGFRTFLAAPIGMGQGEGIARQTLLDHTDQAVANPRRGHAPRERPQLPKGFFALRHLHCNFRHGVILDYA